VIFQASVSANQFRAYHRQLNYCTFCVCISAQDVLLKQLIPSSLAGVILGKGGETIINLQTTTSTVMKMSKGSDFYPGIALSLCYLQLYRCSTFTVL